MSFLKEIIPKLNYKIKKIRVFKSIKGNSRVEEKKIQKESIICLKKIKTVECCWYKVSTQLSNVGVENINFRAKQ